MSGGSKYYLTFIIYEFLNVSVLSFIFFSDTLETSWLLCVQAVSDFKTQVLPKYIDLMIEKFGLQVDIKKDDKYKNWALDGLWVNFQKKHEFNPPHNHYGVYSFVIWMYVPTSYQEQRKLPIALGTNDDGSISNFCFNYTDIVGKMRMFNYEMEKDVVGTMVFFPSQLHHQVFPFFENDEERVSISGNVTIR